MSERKVRRRKLTKLSVGDMRERVSLKERSITPPDFNSASFTENYIQIAEVWAVVETKDFSSSGQVLFAEVNDPDARPSHRISIRYRDDITSETRISWRDELYEILPVTNFEERNGYLMLDCKLMGSDTREANQ